MFSGYKGIITGVYTLMFNGLIFKKIKREVRKHHGYVLTTYYRQRNYPLTRETIEILYLLYSSIIQEDLYSHKLQLLHRYAELI